jgi:DNA mismatch repair protein MutL
MLVIDQHALHERILFEQFRNRVREGKLEVQRLIVPEPIELTMEQAGAVLEARTQLMELGLEVEDFGGGTVAVSSYPALLGRVPVGQIFQGVVDVLTTKDRAPTRDQLFDRLLATMACKAAVKAGDRLSREEIDYLMQLRPVAEDSHHCPHGRPTSLTFSRHELDKQFRRI